MTASTTIVANAAASAHDPPTAADLAARIHVPRRLPICYDGQPMRHLSNSSYTRFLLCPEDWRRWYLKGERPPPSGAMFLGSRVDDALTVYYRRHSSTATTSPSNRWPTPTATAGKPNSPRRTTTAASTGTTTSTRRGRSSSDSMPWR